MLSPVREGRIYYGWFIVMTAFIANFMAIGTSYYIMNAFMEPLCEMHGWSRTDINIALMLGMLTSFASQFLCGTLVMRIGPRKLMLVGPVFFRQSPVSCSAMPTVCGNFPFSTFCFTQEACPSAGSLPTRRSITGSC